MLSMFFVCFVCANMMERAVSASSRMNPEVIGNVMGFIDGTDFDSAKLVSRLWHDGSQNIITQCDQASMSYIPLSLSHSHRDQITQSLKSKRKFEGKR